ncbi:MAG: hypothetical protein JWQ32_1263 [Marmoricola sp.]|nr:hypothetical protein [Marmoricola sp.]
MAEPTPNTFLQALKLLCAALTSSLVIVLMAVTAVLLSRDVHGTRTAPGWALVLLVAVTVADTFLINALGYRFQPIAPDTPADAARTSSIRQLQTTTLLRFALSELTALAAIALAFLVDRGGVYLAVVGIAFAAALLAWNVWPSERVITRVQEALEREGGRSYLREGLGAPPPPRRN